MSGHAKKAWRGHSRRGFSLPELLVVVGIIALLMALIIPTLSHAKRQAQQARCASNLHQIGIALQKVANDYDGFYPLWDDDSGPLRYTWVDVLLQTGALGNADVGYCPADQRPDQINVARGGFHQIFYPGNSPISGADYSYGITVPLSAGGWRFDLRYTPPGDPRRRFFFNHEAFGERRVLAADAFWPAIYNLSGDYLQTGTWNFPTQFDNTVAYRHPGLKANLLFQDAHVESVAYHPPPKDIEPGVAFAPPIDTYKYFVWYPGESLNVGPESEDPEVPGNFYPCVPPLDRVTAESDVFPVDLIPRFYTTHKSWSHTKRP